MAKLAAEDFKTYSEASSAIQSERGVVFLLGFGVTYIPPTKQTLEYLNEFSKNPDFKSKIRVVLIDQDAHRKMCEDNEIVVGTPFFQMWYNTKMLKFRFIRGKKNATDTKPSNVYIGQLHLSTVVTLVQMTLNAIKEQEGKVSDIVVDVDMDELGGNIDNKGTDLNTEGTADDDDESRDTDSGEESVGAKDDDSDKEDKQAAAKDNNSDDDD